MKLELEFWEYGPGGADLSCLDCKQRVTTWTYRVSVAEVMQASAQHEFACPGPS